MRSTTREYRAWAQMIQRCENPHVEKWAYYGGRGITVSPVWRHSFQQFLDDMGPCPPGLTLDRIDNDGNYEPGNCRWTDIVTQRRNTRQNHYITAHGITLSLAEWAERIGLRAPTLSRRLRLGWSIERALDPTPGVRSRPCLLTAHGVTRTLNEWAASIGIPRNTLYHRIASGWSVERALDPTPGVIGRRSRTTPPAYLIHPVQGTPTIGG